MTTRIEKLSYDQENVIGQGGNGTAVFKGFYHEDAAITGDDVTDDDEKKKTQVAIKRIQKIFVKNNGSTIKHEVELMLKVGHHPNILRYIHSEMDINYLYVATELCRGSMEDFFNGKYDGLQEKTITKKEILRQVTKGLAHLHKLDIVHRDIKPTNILIFDPSSEEPRNKPQMKLADFDISKILKPQSFDFTNTSKTNPSGTWDWMAPEVYLSKRVDSKVDVWALGLIFGYTLSGGKHPFGDDDVFERINRIKQKSGMLLTEKDLMEGKENIGAFDLIKSMLMVDPKVRPTVNDVLKSSFLRDEERTAQFLNLCSSFYHSITNDKIDQFENLVEDETVDVNTKNTDGWTPLHSLCHNYQNDNLKEIAQLLIEKGADVNTKDADGWTPLHSLCSNYNNDNLIDIVQIFIANGAEVNTKDANGWTPLRWLCYNYKNDNLIEIVQLLIEKGANVNTKDADGWTPLHSLCHAYNNDNLIDIVQIFIANGAEGNTKATDGWTPLHLLCRHYQNDNLIGIAQLLIGKGAEVNNKTTNGWTPLHFLCRHYQNDNLIEIVALLIGKDAEVNTGDTGGWTPLHSLCKYYQNENLIRIVQLLIGKGADVNAKITNGWTPLHFLCRNYENENLIDIVQLFIEKGAEVKIKDIFGEIPLHCLCESYKNDNLIRSVQNDSRAKSKNEEIESPFHLLCRYYRMENAFKDEDNLKSLVYLFLENGANLDVEDKDGNNIPNDESIVQKINMDQKGSTNPPKSE